MFLLIVPKHLRYNCHRKVSSQYPRRLSRRRTRTRSESGEQSVPFPCYAGTLAAAGTSQQTRLQSDSNQARAAESPAVRPDTGPGMRPGTRPNGRSGRNVSPHAPVDVPGRRFRKPSAAGRSTFGPQGPPPVPGISGRSFPYV